MKRESFIRKTATALAVLVVTLVLASFTSAAQICNGVEGERVVYLQQVANALDARVDPGDLTNLVTLRGTLHYRRAPGETLRNKPTLIFNHGHERQRGEVCAIVEYFTDKGWVVFTPLRRGHYIPLGVFAAWRSTGIYIDDYVDYCSRSQADAESAPAPSLSHLYRGSGFCRPDAPTEDPAVRRSAVELDYLRQQRIDVRDAITYIKSLPPISSELVNLSWRLADPKKIVVLGHSYGGGLTVMANAHDYGQSVAVDIAGGELSWDNPDDPYWKIDLSDAMHDQKRPIFLLQAQNGKYLGPTKKLFGIGVDHEYLVQATIFPPAPACEDRSGDGFCDNDPTTTVFKDIHSNFVGVPSQVAIWGPTVLDFAKRHPR